MEWKTAEELNLALPPPIQSSESISLALKLSNILRSCINNVLLISNILLYYLKLLELLYEWCYCKIK